MQETARKLQTVSAFVLRFIVVSFTIVIFITLVLLSVYGIHQDFLTKKAEVQNYAHLISNSVSRAGHKEKQAYEHNLKHINQHDSVIEGIKIYDLKNTAQMKQSQDNSWYVALFEPSYVINNSLSFNHLYHHDNTSVVTDENIDSTYVSIMLDLSELRKQWFKKHSWLFINIAIFYLIIGVLIYHYSVKVRTQLTTLQKIANGLINKNGEVSLPMSSATMNFIEYQDVKNGIVNLVNMYHQAEEKVTSFESQAQNKIARDSQIAGQRKSLQSMMVDELSHSLNAINGGIQVLGNQYLSDEQHNAVGTIRKGSQQLEFVLGQIIQLQKIEKGQMLVNRVEFNPLQLLSDILANYRTKITHTNIELINDINHLDHILEGDIYKIQRVITALIDNALKYTSKGYVKVSSDLQHFDQSTRWTLKIKDTGIGIDETYLDDIFVAFFQVENEINQQDDGIGVGLTLAKQLTELIGGTLKVTSEVGKGSEFELTLPLFEKNQKIQSNYLTGKHIVYFDTEQQYHFASELSHYGVGKLTTFHNIDEAMLYLKNNNIDVLLVSSRRYAKSVNSMLTENYRLLENNHRSLVVWLNIEDQGSINERSMQAIGVDVILDADVSAKQLAQTMRDWLA